MSLFRMTGMLIKSLFKRPATVKYPLEPLKYPGALRGSVKIDIGDCIFCGICKTRCPTGAIAVDKPGGKWRIDRLKCVQCGYCVAVCPKKCLSMDPRYPAPSTGGVKDEFDHARVSDHKADH